MRVTLKMFAVGGLLMAAASALAGVPEPEMVPVPAGSFHMGSLPGESGREGDEAPRHDVRIARPFLVSKYEITEAQWNACVADKACAPLARSNGDAYPAAGMSWPEANGYIGWLSARTGKRYRFLSEAEWEYAARAGTDSPYPMGAKLGPKQANFAGSSIGKPAPVGSYAPNAFGLYDMIGNVWEWVADCFDERGYYGVAGDGAPVLRNDCQMHVLRGGGFDTRPPQMRSAYRFRAGAGDESMGLRIALDALPARAEEAFVPGALWMDDRGVPINAHGGGLLEYKGVYYWFGEHKTAGRAGNRAQVGVHVYSSRNLTDWKDEGIALAVSDDPMSDIVKGSVIERPKVIHNEKTGKFVMWFHLELKGMGYKASRAAVAVADMVTGPYVYQGSFRPDAGVWPVDVSEGDKDPSKTVLARDHETGQMARDMTLFVDDDGAAYHVYASEENHTMHISRLSPDYLRPAGEFSRVRPGGDDEAPALFKHGGKYFLITSGLTGWAPNAAKSYTADHILGPWTALGNPVRGTPAQVETTFGGQSTYMLTLRRHGCTRQILMLDIWRPDDAIDGRYVWLPVEWEDGKPVVRWRDRWTLRDLDNLPCERAQP